MTGFIVRTTLALLCSAAFAASAWGQDAGERLRIHGSNSIGSDLMPALVEDWLRELEYTGIRRVAAAPALLEVHAVRDGVPLVVELGKRGNAAGFAALVRGEAELAMLARAPVAREKDDGWQLGDLASPEQEYVIALNGAAVLVHRDNPLARIDVAQLRAVLAGDVGDWSQLGGHAGPVRVQLGPGNGGLDDYLRERVAGPRPVRPSSLQRHRDLRAAAAVVARDPMALAVVELSTPLPAGTRALAVSDGATAIAPDAAGVRSQDYPLVRRYRLYGGQMMSALGRSFALYTLTPRAQRVVRARGLMSMQLDPAAADAGTDREALPQAYREAVDGAVRLPVALRFNLTSLSTVFESGSAQDLERVAAWMQRPENRGRRLGVVGFSPDDPTSRLFATMASNNRADIVAAWLTERGIAVQRTRGLGATRPLAGGNDADARARNERVELWVL